MTILAQRWMIDSVRGWERKNWLSLSTARGCSSSDSSSCSSPVKIFLSRFPASGRWKGYLFDVSQYYLDMGCSNFCKHWRQALQARQNTTYPASWLASSPSKPALAVQVWATARTSFHLLVICQRWHGCAASQRYLSLVNLSLC